MEKIPANSIEESKENIEKNIDNFIEEEEGVLKSLQNRSWKAAYALAFITSLSACTENGAEDTDVEDNPTSITTQETGKKKYTREEWNERIQQGIYSDNPRMQRRMERINKRRQEMQKQDEKNIQRASELAEAMGIQFDINKYEIHQEEFVTTVINGHAVPTELFTDEEKTKIERSRRLRAPIGDYGVDFTPTQNTNNTPYPTKQNTKISPDAKITIQAGGMYMDPNDF